MGDASVAVDREKENRMPSVSVNLASVPQIGHSFLNTAYSSCSSLNLGTEDDIQATAIFLVEGAQE